MVNKKKDTLLCEVWQKGMSLQITLCHRLASLLIANGDSQDRVFYSTLTLKIDS